MSSNTRPSMPRNARAECSRCGAGIRYLGRRDLLNLVRHWRNELEYGFSASSSRLADVSCAIVQACRSVEASAAGLCSGCFVSAAESAPVPSTNKQLPLIPE